MLHTLRKTTMLIIPTNKALQLFTSLLDIACYVSLYMCVWLCGFSLSLFCNYMYMCVCMCTLALSPRLRTDSAHQSIDL